MSRDSVVYYSTKYDRGEWIYENTGKVFRKNKAHHREDINYKNVRLTGRWSVLSHEPKPEYYDDESYPLIYFYAYFDKITHCHNFIDDKDKQCFTTESLEGWLSEEDLYLNVYDRNECEGV